MTHRVLFGGAWLFLLVLLFFFPGHEARGLAFGVFIGYFPALLLAPWIGKFSWVGLVVMAGFSGGMVALCAWAMDRARIGNAMRVWLLVFLLIGSAMGATISVGYHEWKNSPHIKMAEVAPENQSRG